jgi:hypothetical protein
LAQISGLKKNNKNGQPPTVKNVTPLRMCKGVPLPSWIKRNTSTKDKKKEIKIHAGWKSRLNDETKTNPTKTKT